MKFNYKNDEIKHLLHDLQSTLIDNQYHNKKKKLNPNYLSFLLFIQTITKAAITMIANKAKATHMGHTVVVTVFFLHSD